MKILSIDVGIKNLSFCLFDTNETIKNDLKVLKWDNIDLTEVTEKRCIEVDKNGLCDKPAKFIKETKCFCLKHAKKQNYLLPLADLKPAFINKQKNQGLINIAEKYKITHDITFKKSELIKAITDFSDANCFMPIGKNSAVKIDLVTVGRNIQYKFDEILTEHIVSINTIIIENQIGPIANKMKTIQGMLAQYFIMKNNNIHIEFISATNKLKDFMPLPSDKNAKMDYKQRKKLGVETCLHMVCTDVRLIEWNAFFNKHTKKDDLSDCFLQGLWYIKHKTYTFEKV
jgi:hypothetical protein